MAKQVKVSRVINEPLEGRRLFAALTFNFQDNAAVAENIEVRYQPSTGLLYFYNPSAGLPYVFTNPSTNTFAVNGTNTTGDGFPISGNTFGVNANAGNDTLAVSRSTDAVPSSVVLSLNGGNGNDTIYGGNGNDLIGGNGGNDVISGFDGNDTIAGLAGDDVISGNDGNDVLNGGDDDDSIGGNDGNDSISGGNGNDVLRGGYNNDTIRGDAGDDHIAARDLVDGPIAYVDVVDGGSGTDTLDSSDAGDSLTSMEA